jgi:hypothetical protein
VEGDNMRDTVYFLVFDGYADWQAALALCEVRRPGDWRVQAVGFSMEPVTAIGDVHAAGAPVAGIDSGVLALARAGLLDACRHTGNWTGQIAGQVPAYAGGDQYDSDVLAVSDGGVISASHLGSVEFAREIIRTLDLYSPSDRDHWYRLFKHAQLPPWCIGEAVAA